MLVTGNNNPTSINIIIMGERRRNVKQVQGQIKQKINEILNAEGS